MFAFHIHIHICARWHIAGDTSSLKTLPPFYHLFLKLCITDLGIFLFLLLLLGFGFFVVVLGLFCFVF